MKQIVLKLAAGALGFVLMAGVSHLAWAEDNANKNKDNSSDRGQSITSDTEKPKDKDNSSGAGPSITTDTKKPRDIKEMLRENAHKRCLALGCHFPKCFHDWSKYELHLTPEQKTKIKELKDRINKKTIGINHCTRDAAKYRLEHLLKFRHANKSEIEKARAELKRINDGIEAGYKEFNEGYLNYILTADQRELVEAKKNAIKEHREMCTPKHNPNCPFYQKNKHKSEPNQGDYIRYCEENVHLTQGLFECPVYQQTKHEEHREKHHPDNKGTDKPEHKDTGNSKK